MPNNKSTHKAHRLVEGLLEAVHSEDLDHLDQVIASQSSLRDPEEVVADALAESCRRGYTQVVKHLLIQKHADPSISTQSIDDIRGWPPLVLAVRSTGSSNTEGDIPPSANGRPNLHASVEPLSANAGRAGSPNLPADFEDRLEIIELLMNHGAQVTQPNPLKKNALFYIGKSRVAKTLLVKADKSDLEKALEAKDSEGYTALLSLLGSSVDSEVPSLLIDSGASLHAVDGDGRSTLVTAVWKNRTDIVRKILRDHKIVAKEDYRKRNIWHHVTYTNTEKVLTDSTIDLLSSIDESVASVNQLDEKKRSSLHSSAIWGTTRIAKIILARSPASVHATEHHEKTPLHFAATYGHVEIADMLLRNRAAIDAQCYGNLTPLHMACGSGTDSVDMVNFLLKKGASVKSRSDDQMTPLHIAAAHGQVKIVKALLALLHSANVNAVSEGGWTPLHLASCGQHTRHLDPPVGNVESGLKVSELKVTVDYVATVRALLAGNADINQTSRALRTALHIAAEWGQEGIVKVLLEKKDIRFTAKDSAGNTPLLDAAKSTQRGKIVPLLTPWTSHGVDSLPSDIKAAARSFDANIVDFQTSSGKARRYRASVFDVLYRNHGSAGEVSRDNVSTKPEPSDTGSFRWIHLPVNNLGWCHALLTKHFIENGASDIEGFKALERSLYQQQYRGRKVHSRHMRPYCSRLPVRRYSGHDDSRTHKDRAANEAFSDQESSRPESPQRMNSLEVPPNQPNNVPRLEFYRDASDMDESGFRASDSEPETLNNSETRVRVKPKRYSDPGVRPRKMRKKKRARRDALAIPTQGSGLDATGEARFKACLFMPYLDYETKACVDEMHEQMYRKKSQPHRYCVHPSRILEDRDILLYNADRAWHANEYRLHTRRTLDQFWYKNINTYIRDSDQVIWRYQDRMRIEGGGPKSQQEAFDVLMVDQLWIWILGPDLIVTSFPQPWRLPKDETPAVLTGVLEELNPRAGNPVHSVLELAFCIVGQCLSACDHAAEAHRKPSIFDMFNSSIGEAVDREVMFFGGFKNDSNIASQWIKSKSNDVQPDLVERLLNIEPETTLLEEVKDIKDELNILAHVFSDQKLVLDSMLDNLGLRSVSENNSLRQKLASTWHDHLSSMNQHAQEVEIMKQPVEDMQRALTDLLEHKQRYANSIEARFARKQADSTAAAGRTILVFTIVTVIFLPLSFLAAFFAIDIEGLPRVKENRLGFSFVMRYVVGVGLGTAVTLVLATLCVPLMWSALKRGSPFLDLGSIEGKATTKIERNQEGEVRKAFTLPLTASLSRHHLRSRPRKHDEEQAT